jgi:hypothetical protein
MSLPTKKTVNVFPSEPFSGIILQLASYDKHFYWRLTAGFHILYLYCKEMFDVSYIPGSYLHLPEFYLCSFLPINCRALNQWLVPRSICIQTLHFFIKCNHYIVRIICKYYENPSNQTIAFKLNSFLALAESILKRK